MSINSRRKGHQFERDIVNIFKKNGWIDAKRHLEYQKEEAKNIDIDNTAPFLVQCKSRKKAFSIVEMYKSLELIKEDGIPLLIVKINGKSPLSIVNFSDLLNIIKKPSSS